MCSVGSLLWAHIARLPSQAPSAAARQWPRRHLPLGLPVARRGLLLCGFQLFCPPKFSSLPLSMLSSVFLFCCCFLWQVITWSNPPHVQIPWKDRPQGQNLFPFSPVSLQISAWYLVHKRCSIQVEEWIEFSLLEHLCLCLKVPAFVCLNCHNSS